MKNYAMGALALCAFWHLAATAQTATPWTDRLVFGGDLRFQHEYTSKNSATDDAGSHREKVRLRFGARAQVTDALSARFRLSTSDGANPIGGNSTFSDNANKKGIFVDMAYFDWKAADGVNVLLGKQDNAFRILGPSQLIYDSDYTPEGLTVMSTGPVFGTLGAYVLQDRVRSTTATPPVTSNVDSYLLAAMVGYKTEMDSGSGLLAVLAYHDFVALEGNAALTPGALGNSMTGTGAAARYAADYKVGEAIAEYHFQTGASVWSVYADYLHNFEISEDNTALLAGFVWKGVDDQKKMRWSAGYGYQTMGKDATVSALNNSYWGNSNDGGIGHIFSISHQIAANVVGNIHWYHVELDNAGNPFWTDKGLFEVQASF